jgi:hypothetical protein
MGGELAKVPIAFETHVTARIPIRDFRAPHRQPIVHAEPLAGIGAEIACARAA